MSNDEDDPANPRAMLTGQFLRASNFVIPTSLGISSFVIHSGISSFVIYITHEDKLGGQHLLWGD